MTKEEMVSTKKRVELKFHLLLQWSGSPLEYILWRQCLNLGILPCHMHPLYSTLLQDPDTV